MVQCPCCLQREIAWSKVVACCRALRSQSRCLVGGFSCFFPLIPDIPYFSSRSMHCLESRWIRERNRICYKRSPQQRVRTRALKGMAELKLVGFTADLGHLSLVPDFCHTSIRHYKTAFGSIDEVQLIEARVASAGCRCENMHLMLWFKFQTQQGAEAHFVLVVRVV